MKSLSTKLTSCVLFIFMFQSPTYAQKGAGLYTAHFYGNWFDLFDKSVVIDSLQFSVTEINDRYVLVDKVLNPKSGKLRKKDFGGYAFRMNDAFYAQHMLFTDYLKDIPLLVRYHVLGMYGAIFVATDDPVIDLEQHNYTGLGILGDAVADAVKNRKDPSSTLWKDENGKTYAIILYASILDEQGRIDIVNPGPGLLSGRALDILVDRHHMTADYANKTDWTAEEIGAFLTEINEAERKSIVKFEGLDFSSTGE